jgi:glycosyltransferase involved in cell wall biosynthesis
LRILVLNYEYPPLGGGAGPVCQQLSEHYADRGHRVDLVTMSYAGLPRKEERGGVRILRVRSWRRRPDLCGTVEMGSYVVSALPRVAARLRRGDYDVVHCHFVVPTGLLAYLATRGSNVPYVLTAHGSDVPGYNPDRFRLQHRLIGPIRRRVMRHAALLVSPSAFLRDLIRETDPSVPVEHIPNGIDPSRLRPGAKKRRLLMTGRLLPRKGFQHVLASLRKLDPAWEVHIAGDGPLRAELESLAREIPQSVTFHGWLDHDSPALRELYETAAIFCLPSESENASIALLEAMSAGAAVVTANDSGCAETVDDAGRLVSPRDREALREALASLMDSETLCAELGKRARRRVEERFDWRRIGDAYLERLRRVQVDSRRAQA